MNMADEILGRLAIKQGLVRIDQLNACRAEESGPSLGERLLANQLVTRTQMERLQAEARSLAPFARKIENPLKKSDRGPEVDDDRPQIQTATKAQVPDHIQQMTGGTMVQFGKYIIVKEILKARFGTIFHGWQQDEKKSVGIIFLEKKEISSSSATFIQAQRELLAKGYTNPGLLEMGEYGGRNYMSVSLED